MNSYNLLREKLIPTQIEGQERDLDLGELYQGLVEKTVTGFSGMQPHQEQPWFCFLVQVAAMAVERFGSGQPFATEVQWREALIKLAGSEEAWCMVVEDLDKPAFMQPPVPEGTWGKFKADTSTPDQLDILIMAKNHEIKMAKMHDPTVFHWILALISLQTLQGFLGAGNYGIARMNGGWGSRMMVGVYEDITFAGRFNQDLKTLLETRDETISKFGFKRDGKSLLWTIPWDGSKQSAVSIWDCDPYFVEVCRRIRFERTNKLICRRRTSDAARIGAPEKLQGVIGDPWVPIDQSEDVKAATPSGSGFHYPLVRAMLFQDGYQLPSCAAVNRVSAGGYFFCVCLVRGKGKTEGFHERIIPIPKKALGFFRTEIEPLALASQNHLGDAEIVMRDILYPSLLKLISSDGDSKVHRSKPSKWSEILQRTIDTAFFEYLWLAADDAQEARLSWRRFIVGAARDALDTAARGLPIASARRYRAVSAAESIFNAGLRKHFENLYSTEREESA